MSILSDSKMIVTQTQPRADIFLVFKSDVHASRHQILRRRLIYLKVKP